MIIKPAGVGFDSIEFLCAKSANAGLRPLQSDSLSIKDDHMSNSLPTHADAPDLYAGFWKRAIAHVVDNLILLAVTFLLALTVWAVINVLPDTTVSAPPGQLAIMAFLALNVVYKPLFEGSRMQATPGKRITGIRVSEMDGGRLSRLSAIKRHAGRLINISSAFLLYFGYWMAGVTRRKQAANDYISDTLVINRDASLDARSLVVEAPPLAGSRGAASDGLARAALVAVPILVGALLGLPFVGYFGSPNREAHAMVMEVKPLLNDVFLRHSLSTGMLPTSGAELGERWPGSLIDGKARSDIVDGTVVVRFLEGAHTDLAGKSIAFSLYETETHYLWACGDQRIQGRLISAHEPSALTTVSSEHLPSACSDNGP